MLRAIEHIRRMRGGAQGHLMRCSDGNYYVVKFQNNPQHPRILVNELLGTRLASRLGLPTTPVAVVEVSRELIQLTQELCIELARSRTPCTAGLQFGSRYPGDPRRLVLHDFLPDEKLREVANLHDFAGMLVFDKWTCNTNGRQTLFFEEKNPSSAATPGYAPGKSSHVAGSQSLAYRTLMIDQGFCFNAGEWNFPDAPLRGLYLRHRVYEGVTGMESFEPWLRRVQQLGQEALGEIADEIPPEWYDGEYEKLGVLLECLLERKTRVRELIVSARDSGRQPFPNWK